MVSGTVSAFGPILFFAAASFAVAVGAAALSFLLGRRNPYPEKEAPYECGMEPFSDARGRFDVRFYLLAILFIVFDLEIAFLFPWAVALLDIGWVGFGSMMAFLIVLTVGFIYEWKKGAIRWD